MRVSTIAYLIFGAVVSAASAPAAAQDAAAGARQFMQCRACHTVAPGARSGNGPNLFGIVGARAGAVPGYKYSPALTGTRIVWNAATLDAFLKRPAAVAPGTKMLFGGMPNAAARANLIAYLATLRRR